MPLQITGLKREFRMGSKTLSDPSKQMSPDEVMAFYAATYPELTTSTCHGPKVEGDKAVYEFKTVVGTKG